MVDTNTEKNTVLCNINKIVEEVFEYTVIFENKNSKKENSNSTLLFKVRKEEWNNRNKNNKENLYLKIPEDAILMLD